MGAKYLERIKALDQKGLIEKEIQKVKVFCRQAQLNLEEAIKINPFDKNARMLLAVVYYNQQHIFGLQNNCLKSIEILERLTRIEKGEHELFRLLGDNYLALKQNDKALINFQKAHTVMIKTSFKTAPDTSL